MNITTPLSDAEIADAQLSDDELYQKDVAEDAIKQAQWEHKKATEKWHSTSLKNIDAAINDWSGFAKKNNLDLSYAATPEEAQKTAITDAFYSLALKGKPIPQESLHRSLTRQSIADAYFKGAGADSDDALYEQIKLASQDRTTTKANIEDIHTAALNAVIRRESGNAGADTFATWSKRKIDEGTYNPAHADLYIDQWTQAYNLYENNISKFGKDLGHLYSEAISGKDITLPAWKIAEKLDESEREQFIASFAILAKNFDAKTQKTFLTNLGKQTTRDAQGLGDKVSFFINRRVTEALDDSQKSRGIPSTLAADSRANENFVNDLKDYIAGAIDPLETLAKKGSNLSYLEAGLYSAPGALATTAIALTPLAGLPATLAITQSDFYKSTRSRLRAQNPDLSDAEATRMADTIATQAAVPSMLLEYASARTLVGKFPLANKAFMSVANRLGGSTAARIASGVAGRALAETGTELAQDLMPSVVQELGDELGAAYPDVQWTGKGGVFDGYWAQTLTTFGAVAPMAFMGIPANLKSDKAALDQIKAFQEADRRHLRALGYSEAALESFDTETAKGSASARQALEDLQKSRDPNSAEAEAAVKQLEEEIEDLQARQQKLQSLGLLPTIVNNSGTWEVRSEDGDLIANASSPSEAFRISRSHYAALEEADADVVAYYASLLTSMEAQSSRDTDTRKTITSFEPSNLMSEAKALEEFPDSADRFYEQSRMSQTLDGSDPALGKIINGASITEFEDRARTTVNRLFQGASVLTLVHEETHGFRREAMRKGLLKRDEQIAFFRALNTVLAGKRAKGVTGKRDGEFLAFLKNPNTGELFADEHITENMLDEAFSELAEAEVLRQRKSGKHTTGTKLPAGVLTRNLSALARILPQGVVSKFQSFIRAIRAKFGLAFSRAHALKKAFRDGTLSEAEYQATLNKLFDLAAADAHKQTAAETKQEILTGQNTSSQPGQQSPINFDPDDNIPFSIGRTHITPSPDTASFNTTDGRTLTGPAAFSITAYHGTPHTVDRFSTGKIGTGTGAQAYGYGLYFTTDKSIAKNYSRAAKNTDGTVTQTDDGNLYTVKINIEDDQLIDWNKSIIEQSDAVKKLLSSIPVVSDYLKEPIEVDDQESGNYYWEYAGEKFANKSEALESSNGWSVVTGGLFGSSPKEVSQILSNAGIRGIRYASENEQADNYVIFDEADITITHANGTPTTIKDATARAQSMARIPAPSFSIEAEDRKTYYENNGLTATQAAQAIQEEENLFAWATNRGLDSIRETHLPVRGLQDDRRRNDLFGTAFQSPLSGADEILKAIQDVEKHGLVSIVLNDMISRELPTWNPIGKTIASPEDVFAINAAFRNPWFESLRLMVLDLSTSKVLAAQVLSVGSLAEASARGADIIGYIARAKKTFGPNIGLVMSHNHPSGNPEPSSADDQVTRLISEKINKLGVPLIDHIITNGTTGYSIKDGAKFTVPSDLDVDWTTTERTEMTVLDNPDTARRLASIFKASNSKTILGIYLDTKLQIRGMNVLPADSDQRLETIMNDASTVGARGLIMLMPSGSTQNVSALQTTLKDLAGTGLSLYDAVGPLNSDTIESGQELGLLYEDSPAFSIENIQGLDNDYIHDSHQQIISDARAYTEANRRSEIGLEEGKSREGAHPHEWPEEGSESEVTRFGKNHVLKRIKSDGIWTVEDGGNYQRSNDYRQLALKVRTINEVDGLPTSSFKVGDELFILQDIGQKITEDEYAKFFFNGREVNGRYTYDVTIDGQQVFISDLSKDNLMKDAHGVIRISDLIASAGSAFELQSPTEGDAAFSIQPAEFIGGLEAKLATLPTNPKAKLEIHGRIREKLAKLRRDVDEIRSAFGNDQTLFEHIPAPRTIASIRKEAAMRQALLYEDLVEQFHKSNDGILFQEGELTKLRSQPIHGYLASPSPLKGQLMSRSEAIRSGRYDPTRHGDYDGAGAVNRTLFGGTLMPDQAAQELYEAGLIKDAYPDTMWEALEKEAHSVGNFKEIYAKANSEFAALLKQAREQTKIWQDHQIAQQKKNYNPRQSLIRSLAILDGILSVLPADLRATIGGYVPLARLTNDSDRLNFIADRLDKIEDKLERHLRKEYDADWKALLKRSRPQEEEVGVKRRGQAGHTVHALFQELEDVQYWTGDKANSTVDGIEILLASGTLTPEEEAHESMRRTLIPLIADWSNADAARRFAALQAATQIYDVGYHNFQLLKIKQRELRNIQRQSLRAATGTSSTLADRQARAIQDNGFKGRIKKFHYGLFDFSQIMHIAFGENSKAANALIDRELAASNAKEDANEAADAAIEDLFTSLAGDKFAGEKLRWNMAQPTMEVHDPYTGKTMQMSELQAIHWTMMWRQEDGKRHFLGHLDEQGRPTGDWHYDQDFFAALESQLSPAALHVRAYLTDQYSEEHAIINPVYRRIHGVDLASNPNYSPITVAPAQQTGSTTANPVTSEIGTGLSITPGSLRTRSQTAVAEPRLEDSLHTFIAHKKQIHHWFHYAELANDMTALLKNRTVSNATTAKGDMELTSVLASWTDLFAQGGARDAAAHLSTTKTFQKWLSRSTSAALIGRISTLAVQSTQLGAALAQMPTTAYVSRMSKLMTGRLDWGKALNSPYIKRRIAQMPPVVQQAMEGLASSSPNKVKHTVQKLGKLIAAADGLFTSGTYAIILDHQLTELAKQGITGPDAEAHAHKEAERLTDQVAQPTRAGARSLHENLSTNPIMRVMWAFSSEPRQKLALLTYNLTNKPTNQKLRTLAVVFLFNGLMANLIRSAWRDMRDDEDDEIFDEKNWNPYRLLLATITSPLAGYPVLGDILEGAAYQATGNYQPSGTLFSNYESAIRAVSHLDDIAEGDRDTAEILQDLDGFITGLSMTNDNISAAASLTHLASDLFRIGKNATSED